MKPAERHGHAVESTPRAEYFEELSSFTFRIRNQTFEKYQLNGNNRLMLTHAQNFGFHMRLDRELGQER